MKNYKNYLAASTLLCSAMLGAAVPGLTYADTEEETAIQSVINIMEQRYYPTPVADYNAEHAADTIKVIKDNNPQSVFYKPENMKAGIILDTTHGLKVVKTSDNKESSVLGVQGVGDFLKQQLMFEEYSFGSTSSKNSPQFEQYINRNTGIICAAYDYGVSCAHTSQAIVTDEWKAFLNGIGEAYHERKGEYPVVSYFGAPMVSDSEYKPYENTYAIVVASDRTATASLFYRENATSPWIYFADTGVDFDDSEPGVIMVPLDCSDYIGEAKKGFAGAICMENDKESRVTVPAEEPAEEESDVKVPNTGLFTNDGKMIIGVSSATALVVICVFAYLAHYSKNRAKHHVRFGKK